MDLDLTGRVAVVTGGSRGIGRVVASVLAAEGADIALVARTAESPHEAVEVITVETHRRVLAIPTDTAEAPEVSAMARRVIEEFGRVDILVNCAARSAAQIPSTSWQSLDETIAWPEINTKVLGYLRCAQALAPTMVEQGWGRIISVGGLNALRSGNTIATIRNIAVAGLTKNLADELGPQGVNVNAVHPDMTRTERTPALLESRAKASGTTIEDVEERFATRNTIGRLVDAHDVAQVIAFLASPRSVAINGETLAVGGGIPGVIRY